MQTEIKEVVNKYTKDMDDFKRKGEDALRKAFKIFFDENPTVTAFTWTQYTPYFNDGDECVFGVHDMYYSTSVMNKDEWEAHKPESEEEGEEIKWYSAWNKPEVPSAQRVDQLKTADTERADIEKVHENFKAFSKETSLLPDELWKMVFGDHIEILATREGFEVEEYNHD